MAILWAEAEIHIQILIEAMTTQLGLMSRILVKWIVNELHLRFWVILFFDVAILKLRLKQFGDVIFSRIDFGWLIFKFLSWMNHVGQNWTRWRLIQAMMGNTLFVAKRTCDRTCLLWNFWPVHWNYSFSWRFNSLPFLISFEWRISIWYWWSLNWSIANTTYRWVLIVILYLILFSGHCLLLPIVIWFDETVVFA